LGIDAIWLSPINPSPDRDFGYDVSDYLSIDPKFGSMDDFDELIQQTERKGIRIVMDLVLNHTSDQHPWFQESRSSRENPKRDWYIWRDGKGIGRSPNNWISIIGGSAWEWDEAMGQYYLHMYYKGQPDLNWRNPEVRENLLDVFRFWLGKGVKGFRLDVFNLYFKDEEFHDNPVRPFHLRPDQQQALKFNCDQPELKDTLAEIRKILDQYNDAYAIGETLLSNPGKAAGYCGENALHQAFLFDFLECPWNAHRFSSVFDQWEKSLGRDRWPNYVLNNHDVKRSASRYGQGEDDDRLKVAAAMLLTLRGTPFMYYGEEIGMREVTLKRSQILDPVGLRFWPFYKGRDGCRTPMQWNSIENAGFSIGQPWLPLHPDWRERNVENQTKDPGSLLNFYKELIVLRRSEEVLVKGEIRLLQDVPNNVLAYERVYLTKKARIYLNFCQTPQEVNFAKEEILKGFSNKRKEFHFQNTISLFPDEALILFSSD
ncbi:MAG: alpha-glucosidase, partial [Chloroflexi bacterium]|nr:alpha-glucosidase [Chloroflexota bacterium]